MWLKNTLRPDTEPQSDRTAYLTAKAVRQLERLQLNASKFLAGDGIGNRPSFRRKLAPDFREHRAYVPGDDLRFVDWRASARHDQVFVKQGEQQKEIAVTIALDTSASVAWGDPAKRLGQLSLAAALGYLTLAHGDRLRILPLDKNNPILGPISGKGQIAGVVSYLQSLKYGGEVNIVRRMRAISKRVATGGILFVLSDLLGVADLGLALEPFSFPVWQVNVLHLLDGKEIAPKMRGQLELVDAESGAAGNYDISDKAVREYQEKLESWRAGLDMACVENKAFYTLLQTDWDLETEMLAHLRKTRVVVRL